MLVYVLLGVLVLVLLFWGFGAFRRPGRPPEAPAPEASKTPEVAEQPVMAPASPAQPPEPEPELEGEITQPAPLPDFVDHATEPLPLDELPAAALSTAPPEPTPAEPVPVAPDVDLELEVASPPVPSEPAPGEPVMALQAEPVTAPTQPEAEPIAAIDLELELADIAPPLEPTPEPQPEPQPEPEPEPAIEPELPEIELALAPSAPPLEPVVIEPEPVAASVSEPVIEPAAAPVVAPPMPAQPTPPLSPPVSSEPPLILVVDDSAVVRAKMVKLLKSVNYRVEIAKNGVQALELIPQLQPHIVVTDIEMPEMDGYELIARLDADPALRTIPVFAVSSFEDLAERLAPHANVKGCFGKPWDEPLVLATLASLVGAPAVAA